MQKAHGRRSGTDKAHTVPLSISSLPPPQFYVEEIVVKKFPCSCSLNTLLTLFLPKPSPRKHQGFCQPSASGSMCMKNEAAFPGCNLLKRSPQRWKIAPSVASSNKAVVTSPATCEWWAHVPTTRLAEQLTREVLVSAALRYIHAPDKASLFVCLSHSFPISV